MLKFLIRYPTQTVDFFLVQLAGSQVNRLLMVSKHLFMIIQILLTGRHTFCSKLCGRTCLRIKAIHLWSQTVLLKVLISRSIVGGSHFV